MSDDVAAIEVAARHEAGHALACIGSGRDQVTARVYKSAGQWRGSATPSTNQNGLIQIIVNAAGLLAQVELGGAIEPDGHRSDLDRVHAAAADLSRAARDLPAYETADTKDMLTAALLAGSIASRFLNSVWDVLEHVAALLASQVGQVVDVSAAVDVESIRDTFNSSVSGR